MSPTYCTECDSEMVTCPWGGLDCPQCDKGHHAGPDWAESFSNVRELRDRGGETMRPWLTESPCYACGRTLGNSEEERTSGLCLRCLNGPVPS